MRTEHEERRLVAALTRVAERRERFGLDTPCPGQADLPGFEMTLITGVPVRAAGQGNLFEAVPTTGGGQEDE